MHDALPSYVNEGTVDGVRALLNLEGQQFARIDDDSGLLRTPFGIVAVLDPRTGEACRISWERISESSSVLLKIRA